MNKTNKQMLVIGCIIFILLIIACLYNREHEIQISNGVETIGVVEKALISKGHKPGVKIWFRFVDVDNLQVLRACSYCSRSQGYEAIIGGFYRVRYIEGKPGKTATIYIDEPVYDSVYDKLLLDRKRCPLPITK